ncbi:right-handed parallel beta-helix repeat-containing protein [candidate division KSB1 bacterium]|nr:right-handed parallel beta-helix repeat-containing protein [candidate division KSB1 bacterium]
MKNKKIIALNKIAMILFLSRLLHAQDIINVPASYNTIQSAINYANNGDTILVAAGIYYENINFKGKAIIVKSEAGPEATIIDGSQAGSVVTFSSGEDTTSVISGFTITNGKAQYGAGIYICDGSSPKIINNIITMNIIEQQHTSGGCGIIVFGGNAVIRNNEISYNNGGGDGGGIAILNANSIVIEKNVIKGNTGRTGGGIMLVSSEYALIKRNLIVKNISYDAAVAGVYLLSGNGYFVNNTVDSNIGGDIAGVYNRSNIFIINNIISNNNAFGLGRSENLNSYNNVWNNLSGDYNEGANPGVGAISSDPFFVDSQNDNYHLEQLSPCIDTGDPTSPLDPDGTRADMGVFYFDQTAFYQGPTWHVSINGNDETGDGSFDYPFRTIQHGIEIATDFDTILVAPGTYYENIDFKGKAVVVQSEAGADNTFIDGSHAGSVVTFASGEDTTTILIGFTIRNGKTTGYGGGIFCANSAPKICNNIITNNKSDVGGGGISIRPGSGIIRNNTISNNTAEGDGGGLDLYNTNNIWIEGNIIKDNIGKAAGGLLFYGGEDIALQNNLIIRNKAYGTGGGIQCLAQSGVIANNTIDSNSSGQGWKGGGIYFNWLADVIVKNNIIANNFVGGGIRGESGKNVYYNNVWNNEGGDYIDCNPNINDISANPEFADPSKDNYDLEATSPCIDTGDPTSPLDPDGTRADMGAFYYHQGDLTAPVKPHNLLAQSADGAVTLNWSPNTESDLSYYKLYRSQTQGFTPVANNFFATIFAPDTSYTDSTVTNGQTYYYRISAVDSSGNESAFSDEVNATPQVEVFISDIALSATNCDFSNVPIDSTRSIMLYIKNTGQGTLEIFSVAHQHPVFSSDTPSGTIPANDSLRIRISFTPSHATAFKDTFRISSNDPDEALVYFPVEGKGVTMPYPSIFLPFDSFDFGKVPVYSVSSRNCLIENKGSATLDIETIQLDNPVFSAMPTAFSLEPLQQQTVEIRFTPDNLQRQIGNMVIASNDPDQPEISIALSGEGADSLSPEIFFQQPTSKMWINTEIQLSARVTDNWELSSVQFYYRKGSESTCHYLPMAAQGNNMYSATIPASAVTFEGLAYFIRAVDGAGFTAQSDTFSYSLYFPAGTLATNMSHSAYSGGFPRGQWHMLSIPAVLDETSADQVLGDETELGEYGEPNWRLFSYQDTDGDGVTDGYREFEPSNQTDHFRFTSGNAIWLKANPQGETINIDTGTGYVPALEAIQLTLKPGWNQIGNPFAFPITFSPAHQKVVDQLYFPDGTGGYALTTAMQPWNGYFAYVQGSNSVEISLYPRSETSFRKSISENDILAIQLRAYCGRARDEINSCGINTSCSDGWDSRDYPEPPEIGESISLHFPHPDWQLRCKRYTSDFRNNIGNGQIWEFNVATHQTNHRIDLHWDVSYYSQEELKLLLYDRNRDRSIDMQVTNQYSFSKMTDEIQPNFQIMAGSQEFIDQRLNAIRLSLPEEHALLPNYPNPFNSVTKISFQLASPENVSLKIFNLMGQEVRTLVNSKKAPGHFQVVWDATDNWGTGVGSGIYVCLFRAGERSSQIKIIYLK